MLASDRVAGGQADLLGRELLAKQEADLRDFTEGEGMSQYVSISPRFTWPDAFRRFSHLYLEGIKVEWVQHFGRFGTQ